jgi:hypothetical protein
VLGLALGTKHSAPVFAVPWRRRSLDGGIWTSLRTTTRTAICVLAPCSFGLWLCCEYLFSGYGQRAAMLNRPLADKIADLTRLFSRSR